MRVAIGQMDVKIGDKTVNFEKIENLIYKAADKKVEAICFPERFTTGFKKEFLAELAEPIPGDTTEKLEELAKENILIYGKYGKRARMVLNRMVDRDDTVRVAEALNKILRRE